LKDLDEVNWEAVDRAEMVGSGISSSVKEGKQAEFLVEEQFPWHLVEQVGTCSPAIAKQVAQTLRNCPHKADCLPFNKLVLLTVEKET